MKLKLNKTLRAALIAAITAVGFTLTQAEASTTETTTLTTTFSNCAQTTATDVTLTNVFENTHVATIPGATITSLTQHASDTTVNLLATGAAGSDATFFAPNNNVGNAQSWKLTMSYNNAGDIQSITGMTLSVGLFSNGGAWQTGQAAWPDGNETFTVTVTAGGVSKTYTGDLFAAGTEHKGKGSDKFAVTLTGETLDLSNANTFTVTIDLPNGTMKSGCYMGLQNVGYNVTATVPEIVTSTWKGTEGHNNWNDEGAWDPAFEDGGNVKFDGTGWNVVNVDDMIMAGEVSITSGSYTFMLDSTALAASALSVEGTGASLSIQGSGAVSVNDISLGAGNTITASNDAVVSLSSLVAGTGASLVINGTAIAELTGDSANALEHISGDGNVHIAEDSLFAGSTAEGSPATTHSTGALIVDQGKTLKIGTTDTGAYRHTYVNMESFSKVQLDGSNLWIHNDAFILKNLETTSNGGTITIHDTTSQDYNTLTLAGTTTLNGDLIFSGTWKQQFTIAALAGGGTLKLNGTGYDKQIVNIGGGTVGGLQINNASVEARITGDLTVGGLDGTQGTVKVSDGKNLTFDVAEGGTHSFTGTLTVGGQIVKTGEGSQTISGTALYRTLDVQAGTLVLKGDFAIDAITDGDTHISYVDASGEASDNGFQNASGSLTVYNDHSSAGTLNLDNGHFTYGANDVTEAVQQGNGVYTLSGEVDYSTLYVNQETEALAAYQTAATEKGSALTGVVLKDATTLTVDADFAGTITTTTGTGNVNINEGKTVTGAMSNVTLAGSGTYKLQDAVRSLGSVALGNDWTGAVEISGTVAGGHTFQGLSTNSSSVKLNGVNTWIAPGGTVAANLIMVGKDSEGAGAGLTINGADNATTYKFTGSVSGTGDIAYTQQGSTNNRTSVFEFTGNLSNWSGSFVNYNGSDSAHPSLHFYTAGEATIGAGINAKAGVLDVTLGGDSTTSITMNGDIAKADAATLNVTVAKSTAFNGSVNASSITVNNGATAAFNGAATLGSVTQNSGASITVGTEGALTIGGGSLATTAITNAGTLTFGGNITATGFEVTAGGENYTDVEGHVTDNGNGFKGSTGSSITIVNNSGTIVNSGSYTVTQDEVAYTIQTDGTATSEGGSTNYSTYYQKSGTVSTSDIATYAEQHQGLFSTAYVSGTGVLDVDSDMSFVNATGGEVIIGETGAVGMLFITNDAKVSGLTDYSIMQIEASKTATLKDGINTDNVVFSGTDGAQVTNIGETSITYSLDNENAKVTAGKMTVGGTVEVVVSNSLDVGEIINNNADGLLLTGNVADGVTLKAAAGDITLAGQTNNTVSVVDLNIAPTKTVTLMDGDLEEGLVTVSGVLTGGNATLLANLTLLGGSTLDVDGGDTHALTLGSTLTVDYASGLINLDNDTLAALNAMNIGDTLDLIVAAEDTTLTYGEDGQTDYNGMWYDDMFNRSGIQGVSLLGDYQVFANETGFGLTKTSAVPEPTTGTLSLLALMALAARRRRK